MIRFLVLFTLFTLVSCASKLPGIKAEGKNKFVKGSLNQVDRYSDRTHLYYEFSFENTSTDWMRVKNIEFQCDEECEENVSIIAGEDLAVWGQSTQNKLKVEKHNRGMALGTILTFGFLSSSADDANTSNVGRAATLTAAGAALTDVAFEGKYKAESVKRVPRTHLLSPFSIPSDGLMRKWVLLHVKNNKTPKKIIVKLETIYGETHEMFFKPTSNK